MFQADQFFYFFEENIEYSEKYFQGIFRILTKIKKFYPRVENLNLVVAYLI
jgi:hypothetical protein